MATLQWSGCGHESDGRGVACSCLYRGILVARNYMSSTQFPLKALQAVRPSSLMQQVGAVKHQPRSPCVLENTYRIGYPALGFPGGWIFKKTIGYVSGWGYSK